MRWWSYRRAISKGRSREADGWCEPLGPREQRDCSLRRMRGSRAANAQTAITPGILS
jgi:hypothetical protein